MTDIKVIKKTVAPGTCWLTVNTPQDDGEGVAIIKVELDRAYPYIWVAGQYDCTNFGLALTFEDAKRAVTIDPETGRIENFDLSADGILRGDGYAARCISAGARKTFYVLGYLGKPGLLISAQDNPVCPFSGISGAW